MAGAEFKVVWFLPWCWGGEGSVGSGGVRGWVGDELCPVPVELEVWWTIQGGSALPRAG